MADQSMLVFGGSGSPGLTDGICKYLNVTRGESEVIRYSEGNLFVRINQSVRGRRIYLVQSTAQPCNDNFMELLFWIDAFKRASAESVTVILPYFSYGKGDKKDQPRVSIRARVCADALEIAGADRVVTMDLHAAQIQGFFKIPVDDLYGLPLLGEAVWKTVKEDIVVVSPDSGFVRKARKYADYLDASLAVGDKTRRKGKELAEVMEIIGEVEGKNAVVVDDFIASAGTLTSVAEKLMEKGAKSVTAAATHGVFSPGATERIENSPIQRLFVTDTVEYDEATLPPKVRVISTAPLFGEAIRVIHNRMSISKLFPDRDSWERNSWPMMMLST